MHLLIVFIAACLGACAGSQPTSAAPRPPCKGCSTTNNSRPSQAALTSGGAPTLSPQRPAPLSPPAPSAGFAQHVNSPLSLQAARFSELPGWKQDSLSEALPAFLASCEKLAKLPDHKKIGSDPFSGRARDWKMACTAALKVPPGNRRKARLFFQRQFKAYSARGSAGAVGKITGYYVQPIEAARQRGGPYQFPIYRRPADLIAASLSEFIANGRSRRIWGRLDPASHKLLPYPTRSEFRPTATPAKVLLWLRSPRDVLRVEIEGSGRATLKDGSTLMVAFAGKNGRKSHRIRRISRLLKALESAHVKGPWTAAEISQYHRIMDQKSSVVFFEVEAREGAIGTQNIVLTPQRSIAIDRATIALSTPIWVVTKAPAHAAGPHAPFRKLLISQDTGGAILGPIRGDIYWGDTDEAVAIGRRVNGPGRMWLLLPRSISIPSPQGKASTTFP